MAEETKTSDTYEVTHDPVSDIITGGEGIAGDRIATSETHEDGTTDTYEVNHDPVTDILTGGAGSTGERISTTEEHDD